MQAISEEINVEVMKAPAKAFILLVDDDKDMRDYIRHMLKAEYEIEVFDDAANALSAIRQRQPDLVITDMTMPGMDGISLVNALRSNNQTLTLPVIMLSATQNAKAEAISAGVNAFFEKPFNAPELLRAIKNNLLLIQVRKQSQQQLLSKKMLSTADTLAATGNSQAGYQQLIENLPAPFYCCDESGNVVFYNHAVVNLWGGKPLANITRWDGIVNIYRVNGEPYQPQKLPMTEVLKRGRPLAGEEIVVERPDGSRTTVISCPEAIFDNAGNIIGGINMLVDNIRGK